MLYGAALYVTVGRVNAYKTFPVSFDRVAAIRIEGGDPRTHGGSSTAVVAESVVGHVVRWAVLRCLSRRAVGECKCSMRGAKRDSVGCVMDGKIDKLIRR